MKKICICVIAACLVLSVAGLAMARGGGYYADNTTSTYHLPTCSVVQEMGEDKHVKFDTPEEALKAGYKPCGMCNPPTETGHIHADKDSR